MNTEFRVQRTPYGIAVFGSIPMGDFSALLKGWGENGYTALRPDIASALKANFVVVKTDGDAEAWKAAEDIRLDHPDWLRSGDTGVSSMTIFAFFTGNWGIFERGKAEAHAPLDADDFGRCSRLLNRHPEWRFRLAELGKEVPDFALLAERWGDIEALFNVGAFNDVTHLIGELLFTKQGRSRSAAAPNSR